MPQQYSFSNVPVMRYNRSKFPLNQDIKTTMNVGDLVPFYVQEILPGDTMKVDCTCLSRVTSSFIKMPMDNLYQDIRFFFVPNRIVWDKWTVLMGENKTTFWANEEIASMPTVKLGTVAESAFAQSVGDYLGIPFYTTTNPQTFNALPFLAFAQIWNDFWRDENLQAPCQIRTSTGMLLNGNPWSPTNIFGKCPKANKFHDYFTSCLPSPQKGSSVEIPLLGSAPVFSSSLQNSISTAPVTFRAVEDGSIVRGIVKSSSGSGHLFTDGQDTPDSGRGVYISNLQADLSGVSGVSVNALRLAVQTQKLLEKDARGGTRYIEQILMHFGVQNPDARLQRSEYLGGKRTPIQLHEVPQTSSSTADSPLADIASFGKTVADGSFVKSFTEHGFIIGVSCIRHKHTYQQGAERFWKRKRRLDYYDPVFANIGEQPVYGTEIYADQTEASIFGYQEAWADYRYRPDRTSGYMRSSAPGSLDIWHFGDNYANPPTLSDTFVRATSQFVDRTLSVPSTTTPNFICEFYVKCEATRVMPTYSVPGLVDHH